MEDKTLESELMACKEELKEANEQIEYLKYELEKKEKNHKWKIKEINKRIEQTTDKNLELYDRESKALIYADQLEKENIALKKEKKKLEIKIEKLEKENEKLLKKMDESTRGANWERLGKAGI